MPDEVDELNFITVAWLTEQLLHHIQDENKWWNSPYGFNLLATNDPDYDPAYTTDGEDPPAGYQRLPMHQEVNGGE